MNKPMTKTQLIAALAEEMGVDKKAAGTALDAVAAIVTREVASGGAITLPGLGKMACRARPERQVRNPATGETMTKGADKQVKFTIAKALKDSVNDGSQAFGIAEVYRPPLFWGGLFLCGGVLWPKSNLGVSNAEQRLCCRHGAL